MNIESVDFHYGTDAFPGRGPILLVARAPTVYRPSRLSRWSRGPSIPINLLIPLNKWSTINMVTKIQSNECEQLEICTIEHLVPINHLVRKLEATIDFSFMCSLFENLRQLFFCKYS